MIHLKDSRKQSYQSFFRKEQEIRNQAKKNKEKQRRLKIKFKKIVKSIKKSVQNKKFNKKTIVGYQEFGCDRSLDTKKHGF